MAKWKQTMCAYFKHYTCTNVWVCSGEFLVLFWREYDISCMHKAGCSSECHHNTPPWLNGSNMSLYHLQSKARFVLVRFWAIDCTHMLLFLSNTLFSLSKVSRIMLDLPNWPFFLFHISVVVDPFLCDLKCCVTSLGHRNKHKGFEQRCWSSCFFL